VQIVALFWVQLNPQLVSTEVGVHVLGHVAHADTLGILDVVFVMVQTSVLIQSGKLVQYVHCDLIQLAPHEVFTH
jgi:hypothetical protein